eukprot:COSAG06_NODE_15473_length_1068_cov_4.836332_3_plen_43_part_01
MINLGVHPGAARADGDTARTGAAGMAMAASILRIQLLVHNGVL